MKMIVPAELKRSVWRRLIVRISIFVGILVLLLLAFKFFQPLAELETNNKALTFYLGVIIDIVITGVPLKCLGKSWQGEVLGVKVKTSTETWNPTKPTVSSWYTSNTITLTLKTPKNNVIVEDAEKTKPRQIDKSLGQYEKGDYVAQIYGMEYPAHYKASSNETRCVICGSYSSNDLCECEWCRKPLVTFEK